MPDSILAPGKATQSPSTHIARADLDALAAGASKTYVVRAPFTGTITGVSLVTVAVVTGAATNSRTVEVVNKGAGAANRTAASLPLLAGVNTVAFTPKAVPVDGTAANVAVTAGDIVVVNSTSVGTGIADPGGAVFVTFARA